MAATIAMARCLLPAESTAGIMRMTTQSAMPPTITSPLLQGWGPGLRRLPLGSRRAHTALRVTARTQSTLRSTPTLPAGEGTATTEAQWHLLPPPPRCLPRRLLPTPPSTRRHCWTCGQKVQARAKVAVAPQFSHFPQWLKSKQWKWPRLRSLTHQDGSDAPSALRASGQTQATFHIFCTDSAEPHRHPSPINDTESRFRCNGVPFADDRNSALDGVDA